MNKNRNHLTENIYKHFPIYIIKAKNNILDKKDGTENMSNMSIIFNLFYFILYIKLTAI